MFLLARESVVSFWVTNASKTNRTPSTLRMGLLLYAKGVTDRWQRREGYKCKKVRWLIQLLVQCALPNSDGRGQGH